MPSQKSLTESRYYAHPQNTFWWIMSQLFGFSTELDYEARCEQLRAHDIVLWDVLYDCVRPGSLDSRIKRDSEQVNDIAGLLYAHSSINLIVFNGGVAKQIFMRHLPEVFEQFPKIDWVQLPSTSPAHARVNRQQKLQVWREALSGVI